MEKAVIISRATPNLCNKQGNAMNPDSDSKGVNIKPVELLKLHEKRMSRIRWVFISML